MLRLIRYQQQQQRRRDASDKGRGRGRGRSAFAFSSPLTRLLASHVGRGHSASFMQQVAAAATLEGASSESPVASIRKGLYVLCIYIYIYILYVLCIYIYTYIHLYIVCSLHTHVYVYIDIYIYCMFSVYTYIYIYIHHVLLLVTIVKVCSEPA